jgi:Na+/melibiose symporter-like transporter
MVLIGSQWVDVKRDYGRVRIDFIGAILLTVSVIALMLGLQWGTTPVRMGLVGGAVALFVLLLWWERQVDDPILPLPLFKDRLFAVAIGNGLLTGVAMFGTLSFVPLFVQGVMGTEATQAGLALAPQMISWVLASIVASNLILRVDYKRVAMVGLGCLMLGTGLLAFRNQGAQLWQLMIYLALMGVGMGLCVPSFLVAVQSTVERRQLGSATSMVQFSRQIGGTIGTGLMGAALTTLLFAGLASLGEDVDPSVINSLIGGGEGAVAIAGGDAVRAALGAALGGVFVIAFIASVLAFAVSLLAPGGKIADIMAARAAEAISAAKAAATVDGPAIEVPAEPVITAMH